MSCISYDVPIFMHFKVLSVMPKQIGIENKCFSEDPKVSKIRILLIPSLELMCTGSLVYYKK